MAAKIESCHLQLAVLFLILGVNQVTGNWKCAEKTCEEPISLAKTVLRHAPYEDDHLEYEQGRTIRILAKPADRIGELWIGEVDGEVGYVPKRHVKEFRMYYPKPPVTADIIKVKSSGVEVAQASMDGDQGTKDKTKETKITETDNSATSEKQDDKEEVKSDASGENKADQQETPQEAAGGMFGGMFGGGESDGEKDPNSQAEPKETGVLKTYSPEQKNHELMSKARLEQHEQYLQQVRQNFLRRRHAPDHVPTEDNVEELNNLLEKKASGTQSEENESNTEKENGQKESHVGRIDDLDADLNEYLDATLPASEESQNEASSTVSPPSEKVKGGTQTVVSERFKDNKAKLPKEEEIEPSMPMHMQQTHATTPDAEMNEFLYSSFDITPSASSTMANMPQLIEVPSFESEKSEVDIDKVEEVAITDTEVKSKLPIIPIPASKVKQDQVPLKHAEIPTPPLTSSNKAQESQPGLSVGDKVNDKMQEMPPVTLDPREHPPEKTELDEDDSKARLAQESSFPANSQPGGSIDLSETNDAPDVYIANLGDDGEMRIKAPKKEIINDPLIFDNKGGGDLESDLDKNSLTGDSTFTNAKAELRADDETEHGIHFAEESTDNMKEEMLANNEAATTDEDTVSDQEQEEEEDDEDYMEDDEDEGYYDDEDEDDAVVETEGEDEVVDENGMKSKKVEEDGSKMATPESEKKEQEKSSDLVKDLEQTDLEKENLEKNEEEDRILQEKLQKEQEAKSAEEKILQEKELEKEQIDEEKDELEGCDDASDASMKDLTQEDKEEVIKDLEEETKQQKEEEKVTVEEPSLPAEEAIKVTVEEPSPPAEEAIKQNEEDSVNKVEENKSQNIVEEDKSQSDEVISPDDLEPTEIVKDGITTIIVDGTTIIDYDTFPPASENLEPSEYVLTSPHIEATPVMPSPSVDIEVPGDIKVEATGSGMSASETSPSATSSLPENDTLHSSSAGQAVEPDSLVGLGSADYVTREFVSRKPLQDSFDAGEPSLGEPKIEEPVKEEMKDEKANTEVREESSQTKPVEPETVDTSEKREDVLKYEEIPEKPESSSAEKLPDDDSSATPTVDPALDSSHQPWFPDEVTPTPPTVQDEVPEDVPIGDPNLDREAGFEVEDPAQQSSMFSSVLGTLDGSIMQIIEMLPASVIAIIHKEPFGLPPSVAFVVACSSMSFLFFILLCTLGSSGGGGVSKAQLASIAQLEEKVFLLTKENEALEQAVANNSNKGDDVTKQMAKKEKQFQEKIKHLETVQLHNSSLQEAVQAQKKSIDDLDDQLGQVQSTLSTREEEYHQIYEQYSEMSTYAKALEDQLQQIQNTLGQSQASALDLQSQVQALTEEVSILQMSKDRLLLEAEGWNEKVHELTEQVEKLEEDQRQYQDALAYKDNEIDVLKDCFMQLKAFESTEKDASAEGEDEDEDGEKKASKEDIEHKVAAMINVSMVQMELKSVQEEKDTLQQRLQIEIEGRKELEDQVQHQKEEAQRLKQGHMHAEKQSQEALTKLNVLAQYFKEKEIEMQKEIGEQGLLKKQSENKLKSSDEIQGMMESEMSSNRQQVDDLKKEIEKAERDFRNQIATHEKKAHENWLSARQAEREAKQAKNESGTLRRKLVELEMELRERRDGPPGLIRPLATRGMPPGMINGPPPPDMRPGSRGSGAPLPPPSPHLRDSPRDMRRSPNDRRPYPPPDRPLPPPGRDRFPPHPMDRPMMPLDARRTPPPYDRRGPPPPGGVVSPLPPFREHRGPPPPHDMPPMRRSTSPHRRTPPDYPPPFLRGGPPPPPPGRPYPHPHGDAPPPPWEHARPGSRNNGSMKGYPPRTSSPVHNGPAYPNAPPPAGRPGPPLNGPPPNSDARPQSRHQSFV